MAFEIDLRKYFTPKAIAQSLDRMPPLKTPVMDRIFPEERRRQHPLSVIAISELSKVIKAVPVVRRGSPAVPLNTGSLDISYIEPQPIEISAFIPAKDLNDLKVLDESGITLYIDGKIDDLRKSARKTAEILCSQSLTGQISYPMRTDSGYINYEVSFGSTQEYLPAKLWSVADKTLIDMMMDLIKMAKLLSNKGYGSPIAFLAGSDVFIKLAEKVLALQNSGTVAVKVTETGIQLASFTVELFNDTYEDPANPEVTHDIVDPKKLCAVSLDAHEFRYCAIDDIEAGLVALPFFTPQPDIKKDPSGIKIIGKTKPFPMPAVKGICWATMVQ